jgi:hypothetical protein
MTFTRFPRSRLIERVSAEQVKILPALSLWVMFLDRRRFTEPPGAIFLGRATGARLQNRFIPIRQLPDSWFCRLDSARRAD